MDPPLGERLRWRNATWHRVETPAARATMARTAAVLCAASVPFGPIAVIIPGDAVAHEWLVMAMSGASALLAALLILAFERMPVWGFHAALVLGTTIASVAAYAWGSASAFAPFPYVWIVLFASYYFPLGAALGHMALVALGYGFALVAESPPENALDGWLATVVALVLTGLFASLASLRLNRLVAGLSDAARLDPLTGLLNRRGFDQVFDIEIERSRRAGRPLSLVVGDLDHFKRVNDERGHAAGDAVLRRLARIMRTSKRRFDSAARIGGEEFALLAPDCDAHGAYMMAERIRVSLTDAVTSEAGPLTTSFGVATFPVHGQSADGLLRAADQALYAAKRLGRDRSVISSAEVHGILTRPVHEADESHVDLASLLSLAEALDVRDSGTPSHCRRVGRFAELMARELGLPPDSVERVRLAGILHDVGRVALRDDLVQKEGPLSDDEWTWVRSHPEIGARMVETTDYEDIRSWILFHHERPDGKGYPEGRGDGDVPLEAAILGVADAYEAMTSVRPYRAALPPEGAAAELRRESGRQFRAEVVEALLRAV